MNMGEITIRFTGICTQLIGDSWMPGTPTLTMLNADGVVRHRVYVAKPEMCGRFGKRHVARHTPKWGIGKAAKEPRQPVTLRIGNAADTGIHYKDAFKDLPTVWGLTPPPMPIAREEALGPWPPNAQLIFDFYSGAEFDADPGGNVCVTVQFHGNHAQLICTEWEGKRSHHPVHAGETVAISNLPEDDGVCEFEDYLLHYVPFDVDLQDLPSWPRCHLPPAALLEEKKKVHEGRKPNNEVYCSNSNYP